jgi:glucose/arabinose dehydrogenase
MGRIRIALLAGCLLAALGLPARAGAVALQAVGTFAAPIYVTSPLGDPRLFVVERGGTIRVYKNGATLGAAFLDIHTMTTTDGERGLFSMAFDPNYAANGLFYVAYTGDGPNSGGALGELHVDEYKVSANPDVANPASRRPVLLVSRPSAGASNHNGGQLQFGKDGYLYISVGDGGTGGGTARNLGLLNGKMLRIGPHGAGPGAYSIPSSNPFFGSPSARGEIWSDGLRNPWRFAFDHLNGSLLIGDVGESSHEEVDFAPQSSGGGRGADFGWPCREGFSAGPGACSGSFTDPIFDYPHSDPGGGQAFGCAITGGFVYRGTDIPGLGGRYLYADLCTSVLRSLAPALPRASGDRSEGVAIGANPVSFGEDGRCELYVAAGNTVSKIVASPGAQPGTGGCPVSTRIAVTVDLRTKKHRVRRGHKVKLRAVAGPCPLVAGNDVSLLRRGKKKKTKTLRTKKLGADCKAVFRVKVKKRSRFEATVPETSLHLGATSDTLKVKIKHRH